MSATAIQIGDRPPKCPAFEQLCNRLRTEGIQLRNEAEQPA